MKRASKIVKCVDCQREFPRKQLNRMLRCHDCALDKVEAVSRQLHNREGPEYEKWKTAMKKAIGGL